VLQDSQASACHNYLAWPFSSNCNDFVVGQGYRIQRANFFGTGWESDPSGGRGMALASGNSSDESNPYLFTITHGGAVKYRTGSWESGQWTSMPLNRCGSGVNITFNHAGARPLLAVKWERGLSVQVPWVVDADGTVRFWRTRFNPDCWAAVAPVPGTGTINGLGVYLAVGGAFNGETRIWATRGTDLYLFDGSQWQHIDAITGSIQSGGPFVTGTDGLSLWSYSMETQWSLDPAWTPSISPALWRLTSSPIPDATARPAYIDVQRRVWRWW
jgi:hypothetical protein